MDCGQVARWRRRFVEKRVAGIEKDFGRGGRKATERKHIAPVIIERTTKTKPPNATHWSVMMLADTLDVDKSMVQRVWHDSGLKPHLYKTSKLAGTNGLLKKSSDVAGLYLNPPEHALLLAPVRIHWFKRWTEPNRDCPGQGTIGNHDRRLQAQRHDDPVRCFADDRRHSHWNLHGSPRHQERISF